MTEKTVVIKTALVIPFYNTGQKIQLGTLAEMLTDEPGLTLCFVDQGSTDRSASILEDFCNRFKERTVFLKPGGQLSFARAIYFGLKKMLEDDNMGYVGYWDAEMATPLNVLFKFEKILKYTNLRMVMGSRMPRLGSQIRTGFFSHLCRRAISNMVAFSLKLPVYDSQCHAKLIDAKLCRQLISMPFRTNMLFDVELIKRVNELYGRHKTRQIVSEFPLPRWQEASNPQMLRKLLLAPFVLLFLFALRDMRSDSTKSTL
ncbi:glycosyltransferase [Lentisphaerota bacterium ZTH]|nr:glycosyltransferase [Lentisphaerota bacterium]WET06506.1 glycosyltransferase [Lentisphaerota bacterium ZTH]